jgi:hypothetical protein
LVGLFFEHGGIVVTNLVEVGLRAHLATSDVFCFVLNDNFFEKVILLSSNRLFGSNFLLTLRVGLLIQIVQVDFVVILVFKGVKRSV